MKLHVKNMVCPRCIMAVEQLLSEQNIDFSKVDLGLVELPYAAIEDEKISRFRAGLVQLGFDLIDDHKTQLINQVKQLVIKQLRDDSWRSHRMNFSDAITSAIPYSYNYVSQVFSENEGLTLEKFIIAQKIEMAKELLSYGELSLNQIADKLDYSSSAHLSAQFKKVTGISPSEYKKLEKPDRKALDSL
ncbi:helix-turn-helix domain-containing protein [Olivibacter sitiensis]|uniref:helix-turn-helix domain-containing protein n=1 Tax=Olivibacter sitiensis TaxID=376470 RepID=UPI0003FA8904|nr:AraC family transcriptional regulator [Olivibacter sitiensis]